MIGVLAKAIYRVGSPIINPLHIYSILFYCLHRYTTASQRDIKTENAKILLTSQKRCPISKNTKKPLTVLGQRLFASVGGRLLGEKWLSLSRGMKMTHIYLFKHNPISTAF